MGMAPKQMYLKLNYLKTFTFNKLYHKFITCELLEIELLIIIAIGLFFFPYQYSNGIQRENQHR